MHIDIFYYGNKILRQKAAPISTITDQVRELARAMVDWVNSHNGLGLSAPQVGHSFDCLWLVFPRRTQMEQAPTEIRSMSTLTQSYAILPRKHGVDKRAVFRFRGYIRKS